MASRRNDEWLTRERLLVLVLAGASVLVGWLCWHLVKPFVSVDHLGARARGSRASAARADRREGQAAIAVRRARRRRW